MCLPSCASLPLTAAVSVRTFLLHFKAPRRLMSYPGIMKGETLMGFEIRAERVSSSHLFLFPLSSPRVQGTSQHSHLDGSSTGLRIGRCSDWTRCFLSFFLYHLQINPWWCLFDPLKTGTNISLCRHSAEMFCKWRAEEIIAAPAAAWQQFIMASLICLHLACLL